MIAAQRNAERKLQVEGWRVCEAWGVIAERLCATVAEESKYTAFRL